MVECQLHRVGTAGLRALVHQFQLQWSPTTYSFVQRLRHSDSAPTSTSDWASTSSQLKTGSDTQGEDSHPGAATAAIPGGVEGLLPLGWV